MWIKKEYEEVSLALFISGPLCVCVCVWQKVSLLEIKEKTRRRATTPVENEQKKNEEPLSLRFAYHSVQVHCVQRQIATHSGSSE